MAIVSATLTTRIVSAQLVLRGESPTQNVYNPTVGTSGIGDASSTVKNAAMLSSLRSWSLVYLHSELPGNGTVGGRGDGVFFAMPAPLMNKITIGLGVQSIRPPSTFPYRNAIKVTEALAFRPNRFVSIALAYSYVHRHALDGTTASTHTFDLAANANLNRFFALGLTVKDLNGPTVYGVEVQRVYDLEASYRPWGNDRMELALGTRIGERRQDVDPHMRVWLTPAPGFHLKADVEWRRDLDLDGVIDNDVRAAIGVELDIDRVGFGGYGLFGRELGQTKGQGFTLVARAHGERALPPWQAPIHLEKIVLDKELDEVGMVRLVRRLREIETERSTAGVIVELGELPFGWGTAEGLRASLLRLRQRGKHVFAVMTTPNTKAYYLASAAEKMLLHPGGNLSLKGLRSTVTYFGGTGELLGVRADFVKIGAYKSAPEQFTNKQGSASAKLERDAYLDDLYRNLVEGIAKARNVDVDTVKRWIDGGPYTAGAAKRLGLVDALARDREVSTTIDGWLGRHYMVMGMDTAPKRQGAFVPQRVAVVAVEGDIVEGESMTIPLLDKKMTGAKTIVKLLDQIKNTPSIRGVVVHLNTPGGSALASEQIHDALGELRKQKPVVCVMTDVAASGGYYIAAGCEKIYAAPSTLTGSLGIFTGKFDISGLAGKLGVTAEAYERGKNAGIDSMWRPYTEEERAMLADQLRYYYDRFVDAVAAGRNLDRAVVDGLGQGRVWSGRAAQARGLVDEFGGLDEGIEWLITEIGMRPSEVEVGVLPEQRPLLFTLLNLLGFDVKAQLGGGALPFVGSVLSQLPGSVVLAPSLPHARLDAVMAVE